MIFDERCFVLYTGLPIITAGSSVKWREKDGREGCMIIYELD